MAACRSLQHIFEHTLQPESPTVLGIRSSCKQIMPAAAAIRPTEQSSVTEIFGELHCKENSELPFPSALLKHSREGENTRSSSTAKTIGHKKSYSLNTESLQLCTEGMDLESCGEMNQERQSSKGEIDTGSSIIDKRQGEVRMIRSRRSKSVGEFPPPIPSIGNCGKPWVSFKSYRQDGRFVLKQVRIPTQEMLHACREDGRLKLQFMQQSDEYMQQQGFEEEGLLINDVIGEAKEQCQAS
ncbi:hypothetical protein J1N35_018079 [Gossypium stocksii]|uniref:FAF domain-containing protein n=1 Tax=Gossypium stocksii TaxID=47602 RepID=A0A9D3VP85_9ROSI|nr:hypothetical protein J1N35_018079 [Gossypium stocksii]